MIKELPPKTNALLNSYLKLQIQGKEVTTPYYRNVKRVRAGLRSLIGKGTPEEIIDEVLIYSKFRNFNLAASTPDQIRNLMQQEGIGVDCSGFVSHILDVWATELPNKSLKSSIKIRSRNISHKIAIMLRFIQNLDADTLTNDQNSVPVKLPDLQPGDLIRLKGLKSGHHIAIVIAVELNSENQLLAFKYAHSSEQYGEKNGVRIGEVKIKDLQSGLKEQEWLEKDEDGVCWTLKQLEKEYEDNGLRRSRLFI